MRQCAYQGAAAHAECGRDLIEGHASGAHCLRGGEPSGGHDGGAAAGAAAGSGGDEAGPGAFADEAALHLGDGGEDVEDELSADGGGVDGLSQGSALDAVGAEVVDDRGQVGDGAARRSIRHTVRVSPGRRKSRQAISCGRAAVAPEA